MAWTAFDSTAMRRSLELAGRGAGHVEPNPMVGAVVAQGDRIVGEGWHARFGGPHAEVAALIAAGDAARGATLYVTLEPCCHQGKTPPCSDAIIAAGIGRVVVAAGDPFAAVAGGGLRALRAAGVMVETGLCEREALRLTAPFRMLVTEGRPWVIGKWAMTLDGRVATTEGDSRWISSEASRTLVHELRGRVDAIVVGIGTVLADDPLLTPRPPGPRLPLRVVLDRSARLPLESGLVRSAAEVPLLVATGSEAPPERVRRLEAAGCEVWSGSDPDPGGRFLELLAELGGRRFTNLLVEGGPTVLGSLLDRAAIDEVWAFVAPKVVGGAAAFSPVAGRGIAAIAEAVAIDVEQVDHPGGDLLVRGLVNRSRSPFSQPRGGMPRS